VSEIFPALTSTTSADAKPGSIIRLLHSGALLYALVTKSDSPSEQGASFVLLNARFNDPPVLFVDKWRAESCLSYAGLTLFELPTDDKWVDPRGSEWWDTAGVIVLIADQFYIRTSKRDVRGIHPIYPLVNIRTGDIFSGHPPTEIWTFGTWRLCLKRDHREIELCNFSAPALKRRG